MNEKTETAPVHAVVHTRRVCDVHPDDEKFIAAFHEELETLTGMVKEMLVSDPRLLLSPIMRRTLAKQAEKVEGLHVPLRGILVPDNPGDALKPNSVFV